MCDVVACREYDLKYLNGLLTPTGQTCPSEELLTIFNKIIKDEELLTEIQFTELHSAIKNSESSNNPTPFVNAASLKKYIVAFNVVMMRNDISIIDKCSWSCWACLSILTDNDQEVDPVGDDSRKEKTRTVEESSYSLKQDVVVEDDCDDGSMPDLESDTCDDDSDDNEDNNQEQESGRIKYSVERDDRDSCCHARVAAVLSNIM